MRYIALRTSWSTVKTPHVSACNTLGQPLGFMSRLKSDYQINRDSRKTKHTVIIYKTLILGEFERDWICVCDNTLLSFLHHYYNLWINDGIFFLNLTNSKYAGVVQSRCFRTVWWTQRRRFYIKLLVRVELRTRCLLKWKSFDPLILHARNKYNFSTLM